MSSLICCIITTHSTKTEVWAHLYLGSAVNPSCGNILMLNKNILIIDLSINLHSSSGLVVEQASQLIWCLSDAEDVSLEVKLQQSSFHDSSAAHHRHLSSTHTTLWSAKWGFRQHFSPLPLGTAGGRVWKCVYVRGRRCIKWWLIGSYVWVC